MKKNLIIIGNGFDLHHHMRTQYTDYRNYLIDSGNKDIVDCFEISSEGDGEQEYINFLWSRLEEVIALLPYEQAYPYLKSYGDEAWLDSYHHDFQNEVEKMSKYWPGMRDNLAPWIRTIKYTTACDNLKKIINPEANFISFNYTNTLEKLYGISKSDICYIHGDASKEDDLVLGHRNDSYYPEWDDNNMDEDVRLLNAGVFMEKFRKETYKSVEQIMISNKSFNHFLSDFLYDEIYMIGLSYNDVDKLYIEKISKKQDSRWHFVYYSDEDRKKVPEYAEGIGIFNYSIIGYDDI